MADNGGKKDEVAKAWAEERLGARNELGYFLGFRYGLAIVIEENQDPEWVDALLKRSTSSSWVWELMVSIYDLYRRENAVLPAALQRWVDDVVGGTITKPQRRRGQQVDEGTEHFLIAMAEAADCDGLTQEQFVIGRALLGDTPIETSKSQISRAKARVRDDPLWNFGVH